MTTLVILTVLFLMGSASAGAQPFNYTPLQVQSLFAEDFRNEQYESALVYGRWLVENHPKEMEDHPGNFPGHRNFRRMIDIYEIMAERQTDPSLREAYLDSSLQLYERVFELFTEDEINLDRWFFQRGRFYQKHSDHIDGAFQLAVEDYERMFFMDPQRATHSGNGYYVQLIVQFYARQGNRERVFEVMEAAEPHATPQLMNFFAETRNELITDPTERIEMLMQDLEENPDNIDLMQELLELYERVGNREKFREFALLIYESNPNSQNILRLADLAEDNGDYREAINYLGEAHGQLEGRQKAEVSLRIADNYLGMRQLQEARRYAQRAAREDTGWGEPFITIAQIYGQAVSMCAGSDMTRQDKAVYWLVLDYLDRARQRNAGVANTVNRLYRTYEPVTPTAEEKFYQNWDTGDKMRIDGNLKECYSWIDEETTIR